LVITNESKFMWGGKRHGAGRPREQGSRRSKQAAKKQVDCEILDRLAHIRGGIEEMRKKEKCPGGHDSSSNKSSTAVCILDWVEDELDRAMLASRGTTPEIPRWKLAKTDSNGPYE